MCLVATVPFMFVFICASSIVVFKSKPGGWLDHCVWVLIQAEEAPWWAPAIASANARTLLLYIPVGLSSIAVLSLNWYDR
jgi:hypothetical protein